jgi:hypothetical protein
MSNKKVIGVVVLSVLIISMFAGIVVAQVAAQGTGSGVGSSVENFLNEVAAALNPIVSWIIGDVTASGTTTASEALFVKLMVFILVWVIVAIAVKRVPMVQDSAAGKFFVSLIIALLGVRFITSGDLINAIWLPSGTLAVLFSALIPFIIVFFFIEGFTQKIIRKVGWISFIVLFTLLAVVRWDDLKIGGTGTLAGWSAAWIYLLIAVLSGIALMFDERVRTAIQSARIKKINNRTIRLQAIRKQEELERLYQDLANAKTKEDIDAVKEIITAKNEALKALVDEQVSNE